MKYRRVYKYLVETNESFETKVVGYGPADPKDVAIQVSSAGDHPWVCLKDDGMLYTRARYSFDGVTFMPDRDDAMRAALCHDALYQLMREGLLPRSARKASDGTFREILIADGMPKWMAWTWWLGVRFGGWAFL